MMKERISYYIWLVVVIIVYKYISAVIKQLRNSLYIYSCESFVSLKLTGMFLCKALINFEEGHTVCMIIKV